jgi:hypothetical protein
MAAMLRAPALLSAQRLLVCTATLVDFVLTSYHMYLARSKRSAYWTLQHTCSHTMNVQYCMLLWQFFDVKSQSDTPLFHPAPYINKG